MRIAIVFPSAYTLVSFTDGRRSQLVYQADALERIGHEVVRANPWTSYKYQEFDAVHVVEGGVGNFIGSLFRPEGIQRLGFCTFIDTTAPSFLYRSLAWLGTRHTRIMTQPGLFHRQGRLCDLAIARSKDEVRLLTKGCGIDPAKVKTVLNGVNPPGPTDVPKTLEKFGITGDFALHVSSFTEKRKNVVRLIEAIGPLGYSLIIAGTATSDRTVFEVAKKFPQIRIVGQLSMLERDSLYAACRIFCLPSTYEGTGLVALEAASHGANILITKHGGPRDYFLDMADYVDPYRVNDIRSALERAWNRPRDGRLQRHVIDNLSWDASARSLADAYASVPARKI